MRNWTPRRWVSAAGPLDATAANALVDAKQDTPPQNEESRRAETAGRGFMQGQEMHGSPVSRRLVAIDVTKFRLQSICRPRATACRFTLAADRSGGVADVGTGRA